MPESPLNQHFERVRESLLAKADEIGLAVHHTILGAGRELIISDFLEANLPRTLEFATGEIVAPSGDRSGQLDIILVPSSAPRFRLGGRNIVALTSTVAGVIEVKSDLTTSAPGNKSELTTVMTACNEVKGLPIPELNPWPWTARTSDGRNVQLSELPYSAIAFNGPKLETLMRHLAEWEASRGGRSRLPNTITVLRENYTIVLNDGWKFIPQTEHPYVRVEETGACLADLFDFLVKIAQSWSYTQPRTPLSLYVR